VLISIPGGKLAPKAPLKNSGHLVHRQPQTKFAPYQGTASFIELAVITQLGQIPIGVAGNPIV